MGFDDDALLAGGSGLVGRALAARWHGPGTLHVLLRPAARVRVALPAHARALVVDDYARLPPLPRAVSACCALGTTLAAAGSAAAFEAVDLHAVLAFAQAARRAGVTRLAVVSSLGADPAARGLYLRTKGRAEQALRALGFPTLVIVRPSLLLGDRSALDQPARPAERLAQALAAPLAALAPARLRPVPAGRVATAMLDALRDGAATGVQLIDNAALHRAPRGAGGLR